MYHYHIIHHHVLNVYAYNKRIQLSAERDTHGYKFAMLGKKYNKYEEMNWDSSHVNM